MTSPSRFRSRRWRWGTPAVAVVCGLMFWTSHAGSDGDDLRPQRYDDLASLVQNESREVESLRDRVRDLTAQVESLTARVDDRQVRRAERRAGRLQPAAGLTPVSGEGVTVTMSDSPAELVEDTDLNPNYFVVHQQQIQRVVNAMWAGGAEAVTIQGQRIVTTTGIKCEGNAIQLQGVAYPQPFVIQGVGDQAGMLEEIEQDPYLENYRALADSDAIQLGWKLETQSQVTAPGYDGLVDAAYARPMS